MTWNFSTVSTQQVKPTPTCPEQPWTPLSIRRRQWSATLSNTPTGGQTAERLTGRFRLPGRYQDSNVSPYRCCAGGTNGSTRRTRWRFGLVRLAAALVIRIRSHDVPRGSCT